MTCSACFTDIADGQPILTVNIAVNGRDASERFTGVVWHPECAPAERHHFLDEAEIVMRLPSRAAQSISESVEDEARRRALEASDEHR